MGDCVSISCDQVINNVYSCLSRNSDYVYSCLSRNSDYVHGLEHNLAALQSALEGIEQVREDLVRKILVEERRGSKRLAVVQGWISKVEDIATRANELLKVRTVQVQRLCLCGYCSKNLVSSYGYGKRVLKMVEEVRSLRSRGNFTVVAERVVATKVEERPTGLIVLTSSAAEFSCMEDEILPILKYSYDNLRSEQLKMYCALFPEDHSIEKDDLVDYWIGEGIIDGNKGKAENQGYEIIGSLVRSCLLLEDDQETVKMHEMALWVASDFGKQKENFIVQAGLLLSGHNGGSHVMKELRPLKNLQTLTITLSLAYVLKEFLSDERLVRCTRVLRIGYFNPSSALSFVASMDSLRELYLIRSDVSEIKVERRETALPLTTTPILPKPLASVIRVLQRFSVLFYE